MILQWGVEGVGLRQYRQYNLDHNMELCIILSLLLLSNNNKNTSTKVSFPVKKSDGNFFDRSRQITATL